MNTLFACVVVVCGLLFIVPGPVDGLTCWTCTNRHNSKCAEDTLSGEESITMLKTNCSYTFRSQKTSCSKTIIRGKDKVDVIRGCSLSGQDGIEDGKCNNITTAYGSTIQCLCKDDLCNGAETSGLMPLLALLTFGLVGKVFVDHFSFF